MLLLSLQVCATWIVLAAALVGWGSVVLRLLGLLRAEPARDREIGFVAFWLGWASVVACLQVWHLALPIGGAAWLAGAVVGLAGLVWNQRRLRLLAAAWRRVPAWYLVTVVLIALWTANRALGPIYAYDAGTYHIPSIRWAQAYAIVPGLGNLNSRIGFNQSYFLYMALLETIPGRLAANQLAHGLLFLAVQAQLLLGLARIASSGASDVGDGLHDVADVFAALMVLPVWFLGFRFASNTSPDQVVFLMGVVMAWHLAAMLFRQQTLHQQALSLATIMALGAVGITTKLSLIAVSVPAMAIATGVWLHGLRHNPNSRPEHFRRLAIVLAAAAASLGAVWMLRSTLLSGYPLFPSTLGGVSTPWRLPASAAANEALTVVRWSRWGPAAANEAVAGKWGWLGPWTRRMVSGANLFDVVLPLALFAIAIVAFLILRRRAGSDGWLRVLLFLLPALTGVAFWFLAMPATRLAGASLFYLGIGATAVWVSLLPNKGQRLLVFAAFGTMLAGLLAVAMVIGPLTPAGPDDGLYPVPVADLRVRVTDHGLALNVPPNDQCWDGPLLCTPSFDPRLRLRYDHDPRYGFVRDPRE